MNLLNNYFAFLVTVAVALFFTVLILLRLSIIALRAQVHIEQIINNRGCMNPMNLFIIKVFSLIVVAYLVGVYIMFNPIWNYYIMVFYLYPIFQIVHSAVDGSRNN